MVFFVKVNLDSRHRTRNLFGQWNSMSRHRPNQLAIGWEWWWSRRRRRYARGKQFKAESHLHECSQRQHFRCCIQDRRTKILKWVRGGLRKRAAQDKVGYNTNVNDQKSPTLSEDFQCLPKCSSENDLFAESRSSPTVVSSRTLFPYIHSPWQPRFKVVQHLCSGSTLYLRICTSKTSQLTRSLYRRLFVRCWRTPKSRHLSVEKFPSSSPPPSLDPSRTLFVETGHEPSNWTNFWNKQNWRVEPKGEIVHLELDCQSRNGRVFSLNGLQLRFTFNQS